MASERLLDSGSWPTKRMFAHRARLWILSCCVGFSIILLFLFQPAFSSVPIWPQPARKSNHWSPQQNPDPPPSPGPCVGARGLAIDDLDSEDLPRPVYDLANTTYPEPAFGSYDTLELPKTWMTFTQRYGPYGFGEDSEDYGFKRVNWTSVNWGELQDRCLLSRPNRQRKREVLQVGARPRFRLLEDDDTQVQQQGHTGRQAIVLRTWSTYNYKPEDYWNIRATITEAGLATEGEYTVVLLVDVKREDGAQIHEDDDFYREVLEESVPREFWDIAVLFHPSLQESWYSKVGEFRPNWQIMQPLHLFAHFHQEFDHYWQFEMDTRFTGDVGKTLRAYHKFGNEMPYKQSRERSSWTYMPSVHGTYSEFASAVNQSLKGSATVWGPVEINAVDKPAGQKPPVSDPIDDDFEWLKGSDADILLLTPLVDVLRFKTDLDWVFRSWFGNFKQMGDVPRFLAAPAQARASRTLLEAIHTTQHEVGTYVPSEATLPSFALWNGLKAVQIPFPKFLYPSRPADELNMIFNGGPPTDFKDGIANGIAPYRKSTIEFYTRLRTWEWKSALIDPIYEHWMGGPNHKKRQTMRGTPRPQSQTDKKAKRQLQAKYDPAELPSFMAEVDGEVYCPALMLHPRKTNPHPTD